MFHFREVIVGGKMGIDKPGASAGKELAKKAVEKNPNSTQKSLELLQTQIRNNAQMKINYENAVKNSGRDNKLSARQNVEVKKALDYQTQTLATQHTLAGAALSRGEKKYVAKTSDIGSQISNINRIQKDREALVDAKTNKERVKNELDELTKKLSNTSNEESVEKYEKKILALNAKLTQMNKDLSSIDQKEFTKNLKEQEQLQLKEKNINAVKRAVGWGAIPQVKVGDKIYKIQSNGNITTMNGEGLSQETREKVNAEIANKVTNAEELTNSSYKLYRKQLETKNISLADRGKLNNLIIQQGNALLVDDKAYQQKIQNEINDIIYKSPDKVVKNADRNTSKFIDQGVKDQNSNIYDEYE